MMLKIEFINLSFSCSQKLLIYIENMEKFFYVYEEYINLFIWKYHERKRKKNQKKIEIPEERHGWQMTEYPKNE